VAGLFGRNPSARILIITAAFILLLAPDLADRVTMNRDLETAREIHRWPAPATAHDLDTMTLALDSSSRVC